MQLRFDRYRLRKKLEDMSDDEVDVFRWAVQLMTMVQMQPVDVEQAAPVAVSVQLLVLLQHG
jgi:hypothetical protein